jgi:hypothetical protein
MITTTNDKGEAENESKRKTERIDPAPAQLTNSNCTIVGMVGGEKTNKGDGI